MYNSSIPTILSMMNAINDLICNCGNEIYSVKFIVSGLVDTHIKGYKE